MTDTPTELRLVEKKTAPSKQLAESRRRVLTQYTRSANILLVKLLKRHLPFVNTHNKPESRSAAR